MALNYPADFKIKAVKEYLKYERGLLSIARDLGIYSSDLHKWVRLYHYHGEEAVIEGQRGRVYSPEFRQMVLDTMRRESLSVVETTARFKLSSNGLIKCWKKQYHEQVNNVHEKSKMKQAPKVTKEKNTQSASEKPTNLKRQLAQKTEEVEYLKAELAYLKKLQALVQVKK